MVLGCHIKQSTHRLQKLEFYGRPQEKNSRMVDAFCKRLGKGEAEAIVVAIEHQADIVVLDDHVARKEATRIGLNIKGTLGIIRKLIELDIFNVIWTSSIEIYQK